MKRFVFAAAAVLALAAVPAQAAQQYYVSQIQTFAVGFCPNGWHATDGALMPIAQNVLLFSVIGTTYGGNGETTFALPNIKMTTTAPPAPVALTTCIALTNGSFSGPGPKAAAKPAGAH
jgi:hypothetical protein